MPGPRWLRQGVRANGWVLLNVVPVGYELWRQFNGFPPVVSMDEPPASAYDPAGKAPAGHDVFGPCAGHESRRGGTLHARRAGGQIALPAGRPARKRCRHLPARSWPAATEHLFSWEGSLSVVYRKGRG